MIQIGENVSSNYCVLFNEMNKSLIWKFCPLEVNTSTFHYELQMKLLHLNWYCFTKWFFGLPWQLPSISALLQSRNWAFVREIPRFAGWTQLNWLDDSREGFPGVPVRETDRAPAPLFLSLHPIDVPWKERLQNIDQSSSDRQWWYEVTPEIS